MPKGKKRNGQCSQRRTDSCSRRDNRQDRCGLPLATRLSSKALRYINDPQVGSVAGLHIITSAKETNSVKTERTYREFYAWLRIGESKLYSTVLYEGELMLVKKRLIVNVGFDEEIGGDDVPLALRLAEEG